MPFEPRADTKINVGKAQIKLSNTKGRGALGLTNKDKLKLAQSGTRHLLDGTIEKNKKEASSHMPKPKKAKGKRKKITTKNPPGGSQTPGAKKARKKKKASAQQPYLSVD